MKSEPMPKPGPSFPLPPTRVVALSACAIALATFVCYAPSLTLGFTNWDDNRYVTENPLIRDLAPAGLLRMFSTPHEVNYHPLALLTYALEFRIFGLEPLAYHLTNLLFHVANAVLLLLLILLLTRRLFPAVLTSLLWGLHPFHVESVTWVAERRDVLFTFFCLASLIVYLRGRDAPHPSWRGPASLALFVLACLSKAMAVTLPAVLLLLEYHRAKDARPREALRRVLPFFLVGLGFLLLTARIRAAAGDLTREKAAALLHNLLVASHNLLFYLKKILLPLDLSALYPYPDQVGLALPWPYLAAPAALAVLAGALWFARRDRDVVFGSLFFLATVSPVVQLIPSGHGVTADRYSYFPSIGILFVLGSLLHRAVGALQRSSPRGATTVLVLLAAACTALGTLTWKRTLVWRDDRTLWEDVLRQFPSSHLAHTNLGCALQTAGRADEAAEHYRRAIQASPFDTRAHFNLAEILASRGQAQEAIGHYFRVLEVDPSYYQARNNLGVTLMAVGDLAGAEAAYRETLRIRPDDALAHFNLANLLAGSSRLREAAREYREVLRIQPGDAEVLAKLDALERAPAVEASGRLAPRPRDH